MSEETIENTNTDASNGASNGAGAGAKSDPSQPQQKARGDARKKTAPPAVPATTPTEEAPTPISPQQPIEQPPIATAATAAAPTATTRPPEGLRLRAKIWTDPKTKKRYLMPTAVMSDPTRGLLTAYAMTDEDTQVVKLTAAEWNALPFFYFKEDGPAPRASARPPDFVDVKK